MLFTDYFSFFLLYKHLKSREKMKFKIVNIKQWFKHFIKNNL